MVEDIILLDEDFVEEYEKFILSDCCNLIYVSNRYRLLLENCISAESKYFLAVDSNKNVIGALPCFMMRNNRFGNVINSLPFYGSNGGIIEYNNDVTVRLALMEAYNKYAREEDCISSTIVSSPFNNDYKNLMNRDALIDNRIGQITTLIALQDNVDAELMLTYDSKLRNLIRKAGKNGVQVCEEYDEESFEFLFNTHKENLMEVGGIWKKRKLFDYVRDTFTAGKDYKLYVGYIEGQRVAAVLVLNYNCTVEYFTPVIVKEFRSSQALSFIIHNAIKDAVKTGFRWWNWGGTWKTQEGVYHFKKQWGAKDYPYYYYTNIRDHKIYNMTKDALLTEYPNFYVIPFHMLGKA